MFVAKPVTRRLALAVAPLWEPSASRGRAARALMEERLDAGSVRGPYLLWAPPRAAVPADEPEASDFVQRVQLAAAPMPPGARAEVDLPVKIQLAKMRDEGGYASVIGGLSRWWTLITERVDGTFHVNSARIRRAPESAETASACSRRSASLARPEHRRRRRVRGVGGVDAAAAAREPLGETGFAIAQAPPNIDPADGTLMRRLVRKRLKDATKRSPASKPTKGVGLIAIYEYAEHENIGSFVKSLDPGLYANVPLVAALVDGEVRPIFQPRCVGGTMRPSIDAGKYATRHPEHQHCHRERQLVYAAIDHRIVRSRSPRSTQIRDRSTR